ncbi:type II secretion system protein M [Sphingomonas sp. AOB5]|uniref:type II secretion system protein M n=1 Tax=Sphingomonas sp. AOB5 TaxID=3034017 RepID=UPI0023F96AD7|nr:type II secretion system protein M [Sphingomonas sp. AOB5]MDF7777721.1 type II secretion system protein M [Sphingomonas sp. AOB5]
MIVRIIQRSGLDALIARFDAWWSGRSPRERILLAAMGTLIGAVVLLYGVLMPIQNARAKSYADIRTYETLNARIRAAGGLQPQGARPQPRSGTPEVVLQSSAAQFSVPVTVATVPEGLRATVADAPYDAVMSWIADLGATSRLKVRRVTMKRLPTAGRVSATVDFAR